MPIGKEEVRCYVERGFSVLHHHLRSASRPPPASSKRRRQPPVPSAGGPEAAAPVSAGFARCGMPGPSEPRTGCAGAHCSQARSRIALHSQTKASRVQTPETNTRRASGSVSRLVRRQQLPLAGVAADETTERLEVSLPSAAPSESRYELPPQRVCASGAAALGRRRQRQHSELCSESGRRQARSGIRR